MTRCSVKKCLFVPLIQSTSYGIKTLKYSVPVIWNQIFFQIPSDNDIEEPIQLFHYDDIESHINEHENRFSTGSSTSN